MSFQSDLRPSSQFYDLFQHGLNYCLWVKKTVVAGCGWLSGNLFLCSCAVIISLSHSLSTKINSVSRSGPPLTCSKLSRVGDVAARRPGINSNEPPPPKPPPRRRSRQKGKEGRKKARVGFCFPKGRAKGGVNVTFLSWNFFLNLFTA